MIKDGTEVPPGISQFVTPNAIKNQEFAIRDLAKSGLTMEDMKATAPAIVKMHDEATAGYVIPYFDLNGNILPYMSRIKLDLIPYSKKPKYDQPSSDQLLRHGLPPNLPYIHPLTLSLPGEELICAEGEKKTAAILKYLAIPTFGIGGCQNWRAPDKSGSVHPWIVELIRRRSTTRITIVPDGDIRNYLISGAYGAFVRALEAIGVEVKILFTPGKIDDLLVEWGEERNARWSSIPQLSSDDIVQPASNLVQRYGLAFKADSKGRIIVHQHTSNVMRLMEEHDAFPTIWRNLDNNRVMMGDTAAQPDLTEMDVANYFQHNFGMEKVGHKMVYACIQALSKKNARSPFLEYVRSLNWDGEKRLDTWLQRHWGVKDSPFVREVCTKWMISSCARLDKPGTKIDWMFIVVGPQGTGKTSMPGILFKDNALTMYGEQNDKDLHMLLHSALCVGFDELDSFGKRESSNLKAMITRQEDAFRPPYGASVEVFPRRFTLYGCGNRYEFLQHDPSGYRRYAIVEVDRLLDFKGLEAERDHLWAEAWHRYQDGVEFWEVKGASTEAGKYVVANPMEDQIMAFVERERESKVSPNVKAGVLYFTMTGLMHNLGMENQARNTGLTRDIAAILRALGADQKVCVGPSGGAKQRYYCLPL